MILWVVKFPVNYKPREIAFKSYEQESKVCGIFGVNRDKNMKIMFLEEDEHRIPFKVKEGIKDDSH